MIPDIESQAEKHSIDAGKEVSPKVTSQQGQENEQVELDFPVFKGDDLTEKPLTEYPSEKNEQKDNIDFLRLMKNSDVTIYWPEKEEEELKKSIEVPPEIIGNKYVIDNDTVYAEFEEATHKGVFGYVAILDFKKSEERISNKIEFVPHDVIFQGTDVRSNSDTKRYCFDVYHELEQASEKENLEHRKTEASNIMYFIFCELAKKIFVDSNLEHLKAIKKQAEDGLQFDGAKYPIAPIDSVGVLEITEVACKNKRGVPDKLGISLKYEGKTIQNSEEKGITSKIEGIPLDALFPNEILVTRVQLRNGSKDDKTLYKKLYALAGYIRVFMKFPQQEYPEMEEPFMMDGETEAQYRERSDLHDAKNAKISAKYLKDETEAAMEHLWELLSLFSKVYFQPDNREHINVQNDRITALATLKDSETSFLNIPFPYGYYHNHNSIFYKKKDEDEAILVGNLAVPVAESIGADDKSKYVTIAYVKDGKIQYFDEKKSVLTSAKKIESISEDYDCTVSYPILYATFFARTLDICETERKKGNRLIEEVYIATKNGWQPDGSYVSGHMTISRNGKHYKFKGDFKVGESLRPRGSMKRHAEGFNHIAHDRLVQYKTVTGLSAPTLKKLALKSYTSNNQSETTDGKSLSATVMMGLFGCPVVENEITMVLGGDITHAAAEIHYSNYNDHPVMFDENCLSEDSSKFSYKQNAYTLPQGQGRARGNSEMKKMSMIYWTTVLLTNGEHLTIDENSNGGETVRVIEFTDAMVWNEESEKYVAEYEEIVNKEGNWGHFKAYYIKVIMTLGDEELYCLYKKYFEVFDDKKDKLMHRAAKTYAAQALAGHLYNLTCEYIEEEEGIHYMRIENPIELVKHYIELRKASTKYVPEHIRAILAIKEDINSNMAFYNNKSSAKENRGFYDDKDSEIHLYPSALEEILTKKAHLSKPENVKQKLKKMGILVCTNGYMSQRRHEGIKQYFNVIDVAKMDECLVGKEEYQKELKEKRYGIEIPEDLKENIKNNRRQKEKEFWNKNNPELECSLWQPFMEKFWKEKHGQASESTEREPTKQEKLFDNVATKLWECEFPDKVDATIEEKRAWYKQKSDRKLSENQERCSPTNEEQYLQKSSESQPDNSVSHYEEYVKTSVEN